MPTPDEYVHMFAGMLPPDKDTPPVCGAVLTDAYDFPGADRPHCPACETWASNPSNQAIRKV